MHVVYFCESYDCARMQSVPALDMLRLRMLHYAKFESSYRAKLASKEMRENQNENKI